MGYRLSYCTEYKVKHSSNQIGNWQTEALNHLLEWLSCRKGYSYPIWYDQDEISYSSVIEIGKECVAEMILTLNDMIEDGISWKDIPCRGVGNDLTMDLWLKDQLNLEDFDVTPQELKEFLEDALEHGEESIDCIRFEWL